MAAAAGGRLIPMAVPIGQTAARGAARGAIGIARRLRPGKRPPAGPKRPPGGPKSGRGAPGLVRGAATAAVGAGAAGLALQALDGGGSAPVMIAPSGGAVVTTRRRRGGPPSDLIRLAQIDLLNNVLTNPLYAFLLSYITIELLQSQKLVGETSGSLAEVALGGIAYAKAISPLVERIGPAATELAGSDLITGNGGALGIPGVPII